MAGKLIGKTRLQKSAYFLESLGVGFGLRFRVPSLRTVQRGARVPSRMTRKRLTLSRSIGNVRLRVPNTQSIWSVRLRWLRIRTTNAAEIINILDQFTSTELELAATANFLAQSGYGDICVGRNGSAEVVQDFFRASGASTKAVRSASRTRLAWQMYLRMDR